MNLETATNPTNLRKVVIDPLSRVEGHGKVTLLVDDQNQIKQARLHIVEFRGFEVFICGRPYWEVPVSVQRLCGICPVSHHLAAVKAMDPIAGYSELTPTAEKIRRLMHYGQILQSHALHFYHLCSPDLLLGFDCEVTKRNIVGIVNAYPDIAKQGVLIRKYGQDVIKLTAGKRIHGTGAIPGGVNKSLSEQEKQHLLEKIDTIIEWSQNAVNLLSELHQSKSDFYDNFGNVPASMLNLVGANGEMDLYHGKISAVDQKGQSIFTPFDYNNYLDYLVEDVKSWSYMKFVSLNHNGDDKGWYRVGPLARVQNCEYIPSPLAEAERKKWLEYNKNQNTHGALSYHWARLIEMLHAAEIIKELLNHPDITGKNLMSDRGKAKDESVGVVEAPRGTLIHHYKVDEDGLVNYCNLIVSTTHNNQAMNESIRSVAADFIDGKEITEGLLNHIEVAIRAYDPCLSCATHALGKMPLTVELVDNSGSTISSLSRN